MDLICAFGGSCCPSKPSIRMMVSGPEMSAICCAISAGSSDNASICSWVAVSPNALLARSAPAACASLATVTRFRQVLDLQHHDVLVVAGPDPDVGKGSGFKPWELCTDAVAPRREAFERHRPLGRGLGGQDGRRLGGVLEAGDRDRCLRNDGRTRVDDRDDQVSARRRRLRASGGRECQKRQQHRQSKLRSSKHVPSSSVRAAETRLPLRPGTTY